MADPAETQDGHASYGMTIGFVYVFNLIIGSGALTMPRAFEQSGLVLASVFILLLGFMSFVAASFMLEAMALANVAWRLGHRGHSSSGQADEERRHLVAKDGVANYSSCLQGQVSSDPVESEKQAADKFFAITDKFEMGQMAKLFFSRSGQILMMISMILFLYGDLVIFDAAMSKTIRDSACNYVPSDRNQTLTESDPCWTSLPSLSRLNAYRLFVCSLNALVGPFVFFNMQKTKFIQMVSTVVRWLAFILMISLASAKIADNSSQSVHVKQPDLVNLSYLPNFVGICIYAFMIHHSLPSILAPIKRKDKFLTRILSLVYLCTLVFYFLNSYLAVFAFGASLKDLYTLNFLPDKTSQTSAPLEAVEYFLTLFPVFTASTSFPILAITLRNNLGTLVRFTTSSEPNREHQISWLARLALPLLTIIPPMLLSFVTHDLGLLVGITGSYAGMAIQYVVPSCLVHFGRKYIASVSQSQPEIQRRLALTSFRSPFSHAAWIYFVWAWCVLSMAFVTINHIYANL